MLHHESALSDSVSIKPIDGKSVHQICSGQVILSLATAVKELVENSIDAHARNIEVRLKDYGMESIEVHDNGDGIEEKDYKALGLKHYTSKLRDFSDLAMVDTFGFRGEALSSLCALSKVTIFTRHSSKDVGNRLDFDYSGQLKGNSRCAREQGTTVSVNQLFHSLPVRHKEFQRNIKKEFSKLCIVLQAYGLISTGVKFNCVNYTEQNKKNLILSTPGSGSLLQNMASIFGSKQVQNVLEFTQHSPSEEILEQFNISTNVALENSDIFTIDGYISRVDHGCGRSSIDRQFYFVNKRPCDLMKVSRLVNETYHMFNRNQYPFVVLDISLKSDLVDVNVTPDKRQLFMQHEKLLLAILKTSLLKMFTDTACQYRLNDTNVTFASSNGNNSSASTRTNGSKIDIGLDEKTSSKIGRESVLSSAVSKGSILHRSASSILSQFRSRFSRNAGKESMITDRKMQTGMEQYTFKLPKESNESNKSPVGEPIFITANEDDVQSYEDLSTVKLIEQKKISSESHSIVEKLTNVVQDENNTEKLAVTVSINALKSTETDFDHSFGSESLQDEKSKNLASSKRASDEDKTCNFADLKDTDEDQGTRDNEFKREGVVFCREIKTVGKRKNFDRSQDETQREAGAKKLKLSGNESFSCRPKVSISFSMGSLFDKFHHSRLEEDKEDYENELRGFHAKISPSQNTDAEDELRKNITKDMFKDMDILGQFNLGFIIAKLDRDLFIIDQHATDEKYNFECLQKDHCLKGQKLIRPKPLELTAVSESILIDNIEIFRKNGFEFLIDESKPPTQKVKLVSLPTSKNWTFDEQDIEELIFMLSDSPGVICRPSRVRSMFASRACRMSTMVGSPLNKAQMKKLVCHMGEIEHPWNCPHGRPTMRHLVNLKRIET